MLVLLIVVASLFTWFGIGWKVAGPMAGWRYDNSSYRTENYRMSEARNSYTIAVFGGPVAAVCYLFRTAGSADKDGFQKMLVKHSDNYRAKYESELQERIDRLQRENDRLTRQVLTG